MPGKIKVLYISYDGMTDQLGQSQVIPYLQGLSKEGYEFTLLSFEKADNYQKNSAEVIALLKESNIEWVPLSYTKNPPVLSTVWDVWKMKRKAFELHQTKKFSIVHCRSYLASIVGLQLKEKFGVKFIFDMRAFYADERVDGGIWNLSNPLYKLIFNFFKRKEREFLTKADYVITLTNKAKNIIHTWKEIPNQPIPIQVVPCCSDLDLFSPDKVNDNTLNELRTKLKLSKNDFVISYLGSTGTWYMLDEMLDFFAYVITQRPNAKLLFITHDTPEDIRKKALAKSIPADSLIFSPAKRKDVPLFLSLSNYALFFIQPYFSKAGSSPTKQGEIMGMGVPLICNSGVGDVDDIVKDTNSGIIINDFSEKSFQGVVEKMQAQTFNPQSIRDGAFKYYSLKKGVEKYLSVYRSLTPRP